MCECWLFDTRLSQQIDRSRLGYDGSASRAFNAPVLTTAFNSLSSDFSQTSARFRCVTSLALRHPFRLGLLWHLWVARLLCAHARAQVSKINCAGLQDKLRSLTVILIIIMSCRRHRYPWPFLAFSPNRSSLPAGPQGYIPYIHCM